MHCSGQVRGYSITNGQFRIVNLVNSELNNSDSDSQTQNIYGIQNPNKQCSNSKQAIKQPAACSCSCSCFEPRAAGFRFDFVYFVVWSFCFWNTPRTHVLHGVYQRPELDYSKYQGVTGPGRCTLH
jgi:hypothetical protein